MQIELATREDIPAVLDILRRSVPRMRAMGNLQWDDRYPNAAVLEEDIAKGQLWAAQVEGRLGGVVAFTRDQEPEYAEVGWDLSERALVVHRLVVDPEMRGRGIAMALMRQAEEVARAKRIAVLRVDTNTENEATRRLFPKLGYTFAGEIGLRFRPGLRFFCYEKRLG